MSCDSLVDVKLKLALDDKRVSALQHATLPLAAIAQYLHRSFKPMRNVLSKGAIICGKIAHR
eukprot:CAMPEP_0178397722 /NCGR_PEP_ID=MMETSP0689_2-20121128/14396_1 /TAXON_ID=160604 /ORGANISM="Amphidinium massartii, Strain CS-259" /LENGTH=61 /DNA_ID=CAMNT_0020018447 /DNA_START=57 /DNA_END=242 /DNA_ORIENTATION=-